MKTLIDSSNIIAIVTHGDPDLDGISSSLALAQIFREWDKRVYLLCSDPIPDKYLFLPKVEEFSQELPSETIASPEEVGAGNLLLDTIVVVDAADFEQLGSLYDRLQPVLHRLPIVNIDHHATNTRFGQVNVVNPDAAASAEIVFDLVQQWGTNLTRQLSELLLIGLTADTGCFRTQNVSPHTLEVAAELLAISDLKIPDITRNTWQRETVDSVILRSKALSSLDSTKDGRIVWATAPLALASQFDQETDTRRRVVGLMRNLDGVEIAAVFIARGPKEVKVSLRSNGVDVSSVARHFGGGGHPVACGFTLEDSSIDAAVQQVVTMLESTLESKGLGP